jgi:hypothetical protein
MVMTMAEYRIRGPGLCHDEEFEHHGVEGQKWGVITRNVGVNYVPIGARSGSSSNQPSKPRGMNSFTEGIKKIKAEYDAKQASKPLNINKLSKRQIAKLSDEQLKQAIARADAENKLLKAVHPELFQQQNGGRNDNGLIKFLKDVGYDTAKNIGKGFLREKLTDFILNNQSMSTAEKMKALESYGLSVPLAHQINSTIEKGNALANALYANNQRLHAKYGDGNDSELADLSNTLATALVSQKFGLGKNGGKNGGGNGGKNFDANEFAKVLAKELNKNQANKNQAKEQPVYYYDTHDGAY